MVQCSPGLLRDVMSMCENGEIKVAAIAAQTEDIVSDYAHQFEEAFLNGSIRNVSKVTTYLGDPEVTHIRFINNSGIFIYTDSSIPTQYNDGAILVESDERINRDLIRSVASRFEFEDALPDSWRENLTKPKVPRKKTATKEQDALETWLSSLKVIQ